MSTPDERPNVHVAGVPVFFPFTPYRAQNALMHAVVASVTNHTHALIESPTGTGKSLALLCSSLAVQSHIARQKELERECKEENSKQQCCDAESSDDTCDCTMPKPNLSNTSRVVPLRPKQEVKEEPVAQPLQQPPTPNEPIDSDDDDFAQMPRLRKSLHVSSTRLIKRPPPTEELPQNAFMFDRLLAQRENPLDPVAISISPAPDRRKSTKIPRIFYATRTHNQVAQVVAELRKTQYRPKLAILASRGEYCVRSEVKTASHRDEICKSLVKTNACQFFHNAEKLAKHPELKDEVWDIEQLAELGKKHIGCPYYASHHLYQEAQLILCPYSFLIDPIVRKARGINVAGDIVILDEAHNIENSAREAADFNVDVADVRRVTDEIDTLLLSGSVEEVSTDLAFAYKRLKSLLECMLNLADAVVISKEFRPVGHAEQAVYHGDSLVQKLTNVEVTEDEVTFWRASHEFIANFGDGNDVKRAKGMKKEAGTDEKINESVPKEDAMKKDTTEKENRNNSDSNPSLAGCGYGYGYGYGQSKSSSSGELPSDSTNPKPSFRRNSSSNYQRKGRRRRKSRGSSSVDQKPGVMKFLFVTNSLLTSLEYMFRNSDDFIMVVERRTVNFVTAVSIRIHCLNAAVCFREISEIARTVVVTSGTLSPIKSFVGELGTRFDITKSLPHVINVQRQIYVGVVAHGRDRVLFDATFKGSASFSFQDSLCESLIDYCKVTPGGILIFFPSYRLMEQLCKRWRNSGAWERLQAAKPRIVIEPTKRGSEFDAAVSDYLAAANDITGSGAILMGVCRGKFSEGIDFRDDSARAVIIIGIPFPHRRDVVVAQKQLWNDRALRKRKDIQRGVEWYETQAFRALNQAVGRAVRHRYDYGAILLLDCRFRGKRMMQLLPQWVRRGIRLGTDHSGVVQGLQHFFEGVQDEIGVIAEDDRKLRGG